MSVRSLETSLSEQSLESGQTITRLPVKHPPARENAGLQGKELH